MRSVGVRGPNLVWLIRKPSQGSDIELDVSCSDWEKFLPLPQGILFFFPSAFHSPHHYPKFSNLDKCHFEFLCHEVYTSVFKNLHI